jgi:tRNA nucleotidyltransferase/poly(A) polymerase
MPDIDTTVLEDDLLLRGVWEGLGTPECIVTGGYLRDRLLGRESVDLDLVLPGSLENATGPARRLAARLDTRAHVLGKDDNRVWRIETPEIKIELWSLGELGLDQDIRRRDFTCNALVWSLPKGPMLDRVGGISDLETGLLRAIKKKNLEDDPVRLVRAARFLAQLPELELDQQTARWILSLAPRVHRAPRERVGQELLKLVTGDAAERGFIALADLNLLKRTSGNATACDEAWFRANSEAAARMRPFSHPLPAALNAAGSAAPLALLLRAWGKPRAEAVATYAWPRKLRHHAARAAAMLDGAPVVADGPVADRRTFMHRSGSAFPTVLAAAAAVDPKHNWARWWRLWKIRGPEIVSVVPLLNGDQVGEVLDITPGPVLGRAIAALREAQVRGEVKTVSGAKRWLRKTFARSNVYR